MTTGPLTVTVTVFGCIMVLGALLYLGLRSVSNDLWALVVMLLQPSLSEQRPMQP